MSIRHAIIFFFQVFYLRFHIRGDFFFSITAHWRAFLAVSMMMLMIIMSISLIILHRVDSVDTHNCLAAVRSHDVAGSSFKRCAVRN